MMIHFDEFLFMSDQGDVMTSAHFECPSKKAILLWKNPLQGTKRIAFKLTPIELSQCQMKDHIQILKTLKRNTKVKGPDLCDLSWWSVLIGDNDPCNPIQCEINTNRHPYSHVRLSERPNGPERQTDKSGGLTVSGYSGLFYFSMFCYSKHISLCSAQK